MTENWTPTERIKNVKREAEVINMLLNFEDVQIEWLNRIEEVLFFNDSNRAIYKIMVEMFLNKRKINRSTVMSEIMLKVNSSQIPTLQAQLGIIISSSPPDTMDNMVKDLTDAYRSRVVYHDVFMKSSSMFHRNAPISEIITDISKTMINLEEAGKIKSSGVGVLDALDEILYPNPDDKGLELGLHTWDTVFGGVKRDCYITIGAESGTGKTTFLVDMIHRLCQNHADKIAICFFSMEMSEKRIYKKLLSRHALINSIRFERTSNKALDAEQIEKLKKAAKEIKEWPLEIVYESMDIHRLKMKARKFVMQNPGKRHIFFVDHIGKIESSGSDMRVNTIKNSQGLKSLCIDHKATVVVLSQLVKELSGDKYKATFHRPNESHIMESGAIKADSDVLVLLWRPSNRFEYIPYKGQEEWNCKNKMIVLVEKNRDGVERQDLIFDCNMGYNLIENEKDPIY